MAMGKRMKNKKITHRHLSDAAKSFHVPRAFDPIQIREYMEHNYKRV